MIADLVEEALRSSPKLDVIGVPRQTPAREEKTFTGTLPLEPAIRKFLEIRYKPGLWQHQGMAISSVLAGNDTMVTTSTSSGKSLIFSVPTVQYLLKDPASCALFLYPTKAVTNDQLQSLQQFLRAVNLEESLAQKYDGSTAKNVRAEVRSSVQILLTNPDMLHLGILSNHEKWRRFFSNLRLIALDESHEYRGIFGANVAILLRRLQQVAKMYGSEPTIVATSATAANAEDHLQALTNRPVKVISADQDGSKQGARTYFFCKPVGCQALDAASELTVKLVTNGHSVLTFCPSRTSAERRLSQVLDQHPELRGKIAVYRAGLRPEEREEIEKGLRAGGIKGIFSTSALELGIDIGALDVCILVGFPPTMMSMWQRAGRVGRGGKEGAVVLIASDSVVDSYFLHRPEEFFARENEPLALPLNNRKVLVDQLACALKENGDDVNRLQARIFGSEFMQVATERSMGTLEDPILYTDSPYADVNIRNVNDARYSIVHKRHQHSNHTEIGEISFQQILREAY